MLPLILSGLAICVSLGTAVLSSNLAERLSSSDHYAAERVKSDTAKLLSSLKSMADKLALQSQGSAVEFARERTQISEFVNSETSIAYRAWIRGKAGEDWEVWRNFFLHLAALSDPNPSSDPTIYATMDVWHSLQSLTDADLEAIREHNADLVIAIASDPVDSHVIHSALYRMWQEMKDRQDAAPRLFECLRDGGVSDPDLDLHLALGGDVSDVERALEDGADLGVGLLELLDRYELELGKLGCT